MEPVRHCMTLLLLLAYVCQSLAAVGAPCVMMAPAAPEISAAMPGVDHSGHAMGSVDQAEAGSGNCCESGFCSMSQCQSVAALPGTPDSGNVNPAIVFGDALAVSSYNYTSTALFRPPISR